MIPPIPSALDLLVELLASVLADVILGAAAIAVFVATRQS